LPAPDEITRRTVLGLGATANLDDAEAAFKRLSTQHHPDHVGSYTQMAELNPVIAAARAQLGNKS
jgi:DnaJ-class molecular chaperone